MRRRTSIPPRSRSRSRRRPATTRRRRFSARRPSSDRPTKKAPPFPAGLLSLAFDDGLAALRRHREVEVVEGVFGDAEPQILVGAERLQAVVDLLELGILGRKLVVVLVGLVEARFEHGA